MGCCPVREPGDHDVALREREPASREGAPTVMPERFVRLPGGSFVVGTEHPEIKADGESPVRRVRLRPFAIDPHSVTNRWFAEFVDATGYVTDAERYGWSFVFYQFVPESVGPTQGVVQTPWWRRVDGAYWRAPEGPDSGIDDRLDHPATHISWNDAVAFATWAGGRLPNEAEWEYAAAGGEIGRRFPWGEREPDDGDFQPCNIWQGDFPNTNLGLDGWLGTCPVDAFEPNTFGLFNMAGNVWEWCADPFRVRSLSRAGKERDKLARKQDERLAKGGSYMCHKSYCYRYRVAARLGNTADTSAGHTGFRIVYDLPE